MNAAIYILFAIALGCSLAGAFFYGAQHEFRRNRAAINELTEQRDAANREMVRAVNWAREWRANAIQAVKLLDPVVGARLQQQFVASDVQANLNRIAAKGK